ncbi:MAG: alpha-amylase family protein [Gemmatimonadales bacterium]
MTPYTSLPFRIRPALVALTVVLAGCGGGDGDPPPTGSLPPDRPSLSQQYRPSGHAAAGDAFVHLFEWRWTDIAAECENVLGPAGFHAVQVSPPQEHSLEPPNYPWSERYQPVSYSVERSRSGTGDEFRAMVTRCRAAGVGIIVDAVINHMTNFPSPGVGSNGTAYSKYEYPGLYTQADFHPPCGITDYGNAANVQDCELFSLPDLDTGRASVRQKIADYLVGLARMGVAGFRVDAAKHIQQVELDEILGLVNRTLVGEGRPIPYVYLEVNGGAGEALSERDYFGEGYASGGAADVTEFTFVGVGNKFRKLGGEHISQLNPTGPPGSQFSATAWGLIPGDKAVVFLQNHDTQHECGISYRDGAVFRNANVWMLAQPFGYPSVLSSYGFVCPTGNAMGPPSDAGGVTRPVTCAASLETAGVGDWVCEHRDPSIRAMVGFRKVAAGTEITTWWDDGGDGIAFSRGDRGFVAINNGNAALAATVPTSLAPGSYCDRLTGGLAAGACAGAEIVVAADGSVALNLAARSAIAIDVETKR